MHQISISRRASAWAILLAAQALSLVVGVTPVLADLPMTGQYVPQLQAVDSLLQSFMAGKPIPGGTIAITHNQQVIYERGIGYSNQLHSKTMQENALMRLASVSKPITASAIKQLVHDGQLNLNAKVFNINGNGGILNITPYNGVLGDSRLRDITVDELLQHQGGWNRDTAGDLAFRDVQIANAMGVPSPAGIANSARYILSQPLQFTPGTSSNYSNIGYMFLGMVVESVSGQGYENYVDSKVLAPAGIPAWEVNAGHTFAANQDPREPFYLSPSVAQNVYNPSGPVVSSSYGGWDHEKALAYGGLIASAKAIAQLAETRVAAGPDIGLLRDDYKGTNYLWIHTGALDGTNTVMLQASWKDWTYSILLDRRPNDGSSYVDALINPLQSILEGLTAWPSALVYAGDFTNNQWLTADDVTLFKQALAAGNATAFTAAHPAARYQAGDLDGNGTVNTADADSFIGALQHAGVPASYYARLPGDATWDDLVNGVDYTVWADHFLQSGKTWTTGDFNGDGLVDGVDYTVWADHFAPFGTQVSAVPEPSAFALAGIGALALCATYLRRRLQPSVDPKSSTSW